MSQTTLEERNAIQASVRSLMDDRNTEADVRRVMETTEGHDPAVWAQLVELGLTGLVIAPEFGGAGLGPVELELVMEETGAALLASPLLSSSVLAAGLLAAANDAAVNKRLLPAMAAGKTIATVAMTGDAGTWTADGVAVSARADGDKWLLDGRANYVTHAQLADVLLVLARTPAGIRIFEVAAKAAGVAISPLPTFDRTLRLARIDFAGVAATPVGTAGWPAAEAALQLVLVALAGEQAGGARRMFEKTVDYAKTRIQFGRAIGSFQAIKHMAADLLIEVESATSAARAAATALDAAGEGSNEPADAAVHLAAFACADAYTTVTATAVQMHGGIAFTWEHPAHLYLRRARAQAQLFGTPAYHRERFLTALGA